MFGLGDMGHIVDLVTGGHTLALAVFITPLHIHCHAPSLCLDGLGARGHVSYLIPRPLRRPCSDKEGEKGRGPYKFSPAYGHGAFPLTGSAGATWQSQQGGVIFEYSWQGSQNLPFDSWHPKQVPRRFILYLDPSVAL